MITDTDTDTATIAVLSPDALEESIGVPEVESKHAENLAEALDESDLRAIATRCQDWLEWDEDSRRDWFNREARGIQLLGVTDHRGKEPPFPGAAQVAHPLLSEACIQFQARAIAELWPPGGPAKTIVLGEKTEQRTDQARRVEGYLNYKLTEEMDQAYESMDSMLFRLPLSGSMFKRTYLDQLTGSIETEVVQPQDFVVPYNADETLLKAYRYTHIKRMDTRQVRQRMEAGEFRFIDDLRPPDDEHEYGNEIRVRVEIDSSEGRDHIIYDDDNRHTICYMHCHLNLENATDNRAGKGLHPYLVIFEREEYEVYGVYRDWAEGDESEERIEQYEHYKMFPGLGFYGYGFLHFLGSITDAASGAINALLDAAARDNTDAGFVSDTVDLTRSNDGPLGMGEWRSVPATHDELRKAFFAMPKTAPSNVLFQLMGHLEDLGRRFSSTTETMVGEGTANVPVGTTLARIEQGMKIYTAVHKRLHKCLGRELKRTAALVPKTIPEYYPYAVEGESRMIMGADFSEEVDVVPVSDPNIVTQAQKLHVGEYVLSLAEKAPHLYDVRALHHHILTTMRVPYADDILLPPQDEMSARTGPVEEYMSIMSGNPIKAYPEQDHEAHLVTHQGQMQMLEGEGNQELIPVMMAHVREHQAWQYFLLMQAQLAPVGVVLTPGMMGDDRSEEQRPEVLPEQENLIASMVAQATMAMQQAAPPPQEQATGDQEALRMAEMDAGEEARNDARTQAEIARGDAKTAAEIGRKARAQEAELEMRTIGGIAAEQEARQGVGVQAPVQGGRY